MKPFEALPYHGADNARSADKQKLDKQQIDESRKENRDALLDFRHIVVVNVVEPTVFVEGFVEARQAFSHKVVAARASVDDVRESDSDESCNKRSVFERVDVGNFRQSRAVDSQTDEMNDVAEAGMSAFIFPSAQTIPYAKLQAPASE